jgi:hypothetical protein
MRTIFTVCLLCLALSLSAQNRGLEVVAAEVVGRDAAIGKQWAVFIAIDRYKEWGPLSNPVKDAKEIRDILTRDYFIDEVVEKYDQDATAANIRRLFEDLRQRVGINDSVFVFYAGHGYTDTVTNTGSWIPVDGGRDVYEQNRWLPNVQIRNMLSALLAKHVFLIADACFSGDILDTNRGASPQINNDYFKRAYSRLSRQVMTSGASESVPDASEFAQRLKSTLLRADKSCVDPEYLFQNVREVRSTQPLLGVIRGADHQDGGSFLFFKRPNQATAQPVVAPQRDALVAGEPMPRWVRELSSPADALWFVGKSDKITEDMSYLEAKSGALADVLTQFMLFKAAKVENMITGTETKQGNNASISSQESITRVTGSIDTSGLYQQAEWIGPDGTIYVLYIYPLYSHEFKPDMPSVFSNISLRNDRVYFIGNAVSPDGDMEALSRQAEQNARMQMLLWLGGSFVGDFADGYKDEYAKSGEYDDSSSFEASLRFTSQINQQALSLRQDHNIVQKETDLSYHYYGLYSISSTVESRRVPAYEFFTYYAQSKETQTASDVSISANFNGNRYARDIFPARPSVTSDVLPEWLNDFPPDDVLWGISSAAAKSLVVQNLVAQVRAVTSIAQQVNTRVQNMITPYDDGTEVAVYGSESVMDTSNVKKRRDTVTADGTTWHIWEYSKADAAKDALRQIEQLKDNGYTEFITEDALRLMDEQLNKSKK